MAGGRAYRRVERIPDHPLPARREKNRAKISGDEKILPPDKAA